MLPLAGTWHGTIVALGPGVPSQDTHNPDPARRTRNLVGTDLFWNLRWNPAARKFTGGRLYAPAGPGNFDRSLARRPQHAPLAGPCANDDPYHHLSPRYQLTCLLAACS